MAAGSVHEQIASASITLYKSLCKKGKPLEGEWTLMATIAITDETQNGVVTVVSLGTGSKCIGEHKMSSEGWLVNDSHAEILARRGLIRYLLCQLKLVLQGDHSPIFEASCDSNGLYCVRKEIKFHFFCTQSPCGDACIFPCTTQTKHPLHLSPLSEQCSNITGPIVEEKCKRQRIDNTVETILVKETIDGKEGLIQEDLTTRDTNLDLHRTGAKSVRQNDDPHLPGLAYHRVGLLRTKPGRGDPTLSMSCSDKMMRWNIFGCQGALLSHLIATPIYLQTITIGNTLYDQCAIERALVDRLSDCLLNSRVTERGYTVHTPHIQDINCHNIDPLIVQSQFTDGVNKKLAPGGIVWYASSPLTHEGIVQGYRQGANRKKEPHSKSSVSICKRKIFQSFQDIVCMIPMERLPVSLKDHHAIKDSSYYSVKKSSFIYQETKELFLSHFPNWLTNRPQLEYFFL